MTIQSPCIHHYFERQVALQPQAIAVIDQNQQHLTYSELNQKANQLAYYLQSLGVQQEALVGICLERSVEMVVSLLAILKAGCAYVPLDPSYPQERLDFTIHDAQAFCLLTQESLQSLFPQSSIPTICLDQERAAIAQFSTDNPSVTVEPDNLAYIIYTSGSTGKPKGVAIEHRNTVALINWAQNFYPPSTLAGVLASTSICFDLSIFELFVTLSCGGKVILAENALQLPSLSAANQVTLINTVPSAIATLLKIQGIPSSVRTVNLAGEALSAKLVQNLYKLDFIQEIYNLYGPSEDTTYSTVALIPRDYSEIPPIGKAIAQTKIYLLNSELEPVPQGSEGEIYLAGAGLARGYLHRPELTDTKFIPNPFQDEFGTKLYKTGDLGICLPNGNYRFLGRIDHLVKLHGFRIELGEIEIVLEQHPNVNQAVVSVQPFLAEEQRLVAYILTNSLHGILDDLKSSLQQKLPSYMIPSHFVELAQFPLTPNGKIDRKALPVPHWQRTEGQIYEPPTTPIEIQLAEIWQHFLKIDKIGIHDSFFDLGGDSLLLAQMLYRILKVFEIEVSFEYFLAQPTVKSLAKAIASQDSISLNPPPFEDLELASDIYPNSSPIVTTPNSGILLTGVTGMLGIYLLYELLEQTSVPIYCLMRSKSTSEGISLTKTRLFDLMQSKGTSEGISPIKTHLQMNELWEEEWQFRIIPILGDLSQPLLGLGAEGFEYLAQQITAIYHSGAWVNIVYPYSLLRATNVNGTEEILRLACLHHTKHVHFISTVDVFPSTGIRQVSETDAIGQTHLCSGYAESKVVAEQLVMQADHRGLPVTIYRPSNIIGTGQRGIIANGFITKMLESCMQMGIAPNLQALVNLVPVDYVSKAVVTLSQERKVRGKSFHLINSQAMAWITLVELINNEGCKLKLVPHENWYGQLDQFVSQNIDIGLSPMMLPLADPNFMQRSLGAFKYSNAETLATLDQLGISCPSVNNLVKRNLDFINGRYRLIMLANKVIPRPLANPFPERASRLRILLQNRFLQ